MVEQGDKIGHPSAKAELNGTHVHIARKFNAKDPADGHCLHDERLCRG